MDFSHVVNFPYVRHGGAGTGFIEAVKKQLNTLNQDHTTELFDQSNKLRSLHKQRTQKMVYVILEAGSASTPEKLFNGHWHTRPMGDISMETFNSIA